MHLPYYTEILILRTANMGSAQALSAPPPPKRLRTHLYGVYRDDRLGKLTKNHLRTESTKMNLSSRSCLAVFHQV